jgi:hypothetical protein
VPTAAFPYTRHAFVCAGTILHTEERHDQNSLPHVIGIINSRRMRWEVRVAGTGTDNGHAVWPSPYGGWITKDSALTAAKGHREPFQR